MGEHTQEVKAIYLVCSSVVTKKGLETAYIIFITGIEKLLNNLVNPNIFDMHIEHPDRNSAVF